MNTSPAPDTTCQIAAAFRLELDVAQKQVGATAPNPAMGCVLLGSAGEVLIPAAHLGAGQPHARARATQMARERGKFIVMRQARRRGFRPFVACDIPDVLHFHAAQGRIEVLVEAGPTRTELFRQTGPWDDWVLIRKGPPGQADSITTSGPQG